jgi:hypothetical protein
VIVWPYLSFVFSQKDLLEFSIKYASTPGLAPSFEWGLPSGPFQGPLTLRQLDASSNVLIAIPQGIFVHSCLYFEGNPVIPNLAQMMPAHVTSRVAQTSPTMPFSATPTSTTPVTGIQQGMFLKFNLNDAGIANVLNSTKPRGRMHPMHQSKMLYFLL